MYMYQNLLQNFEKMVFLKLVILGVANDLTLEVW